MEKIIIINWRWNDDSFTKNSFKEMKIKDQDLYQCYFFDYTFENNNKKRVVEEFNNKLENLNAKEKILFLHKKFDYGYPILKENIVNFPGLVVEFEQGGKERIYLRDDKKGIIDPNLKYKGHITSHYKNNIIPQDKFITVWNYYWFETAKKKIINLFLPLVLDMQMIDKFKTTHEKYKNLEIILKFETNKENYTIALMEEWENIIKKYDWLKKIEIDFDKLKIFIEKLNDQTQITSFIENKEYNTFIEWFQDVMININSKINDSSVKRSK
jgi:hypothetical protein